MKRFARTLLLVSAGMIAAGALATVAAQTASVPITAPQPATPQATAPQPAEPAPSVAPDASAPPPPLMDAPGTTLMLRGLDKITGRPTDITAPIGKPVHFATLTITARYCYSTPASETPEDLRLMRLIDEQYTACPFYGSRRMTAWLTQQG